jgi:serine/threonine protein kinase
MGKGFPADYFYFPNADYFSPPRLHHDMKPSNILVFSNGLLDDKFVYQFKIGDFGASYLIPSNANLQPINRGTTRTYGIFPILKQTTSS